MGAFTIIFDAQGRVLLGHRRDMDAWNLPGGGVEPGELPSEAAIRETREETGLKVTLERLVGIYGKVDKDEIVFSFTARIVGGELLTKTDETDDCRYFAPETLPRNTSPKQVERIYDALHHREGSMPLFHCQTGPSTQEMLRRLGKDPAS